MRILGEITSFEESDGFFGKKYAVVINGESYRLTPNSYKAYSQQFKPGDRAEYCDDDRCISVTSEEDVRIREERTAAMKKGQGFLGGMFSFHGRDV